MGAWWGHTKRGHIKQLHVTAVPDPCHSVVPKPHPGAADGKVRGKAWGSKSVWEASELSHFGVFSPKAMRVSSSQQAFLGKVSSSVGGCAQHAVLLPRYSTTSVRFYRFLFISG